jgi:hypothetical protein
MGETAFEGLDLSKISLLSSTLFLCLLAHVTRLEGPAGQEGVSLEEDGDLCRLADSLTFICCPFLTLFWQL